MCVSTVSTEHDWNFETTRMAPVLDLPLPPLDEKRFRFVEVLAQQDRPIGQIELYHDCQQNCKVVGKRMLRSWTLGSAKEFEDEHPELLESPWKELALSLFVGSTEMKGICKCYGAFEDPKGDVLIFLEYICGGDIHDLARRCTTEPGPEREAKAWPVILSLLGAVQSLHHIGVAHGDISLENALLSPDGEVRLVDFAASVTDTRTRGIRGKPSYQAPEMHTPNSYDPFAADLFACGVFAYCLVVADYPWRCTSPNKCAAFDFYLLHGLPAFLAQRKVRFEGMQRFQRLVIQNPPVDLEEKRVQELGLGVARTAEDCPRPSWEAFFGAASELLYYSPHVHADYVPFLACVMKPPELLPKDWILKFFEHLYCGLVSDAIDMLRSDENAARFLRLRSMLHWNGERYQQRQDVRPLIPVSVAPLRCYLKAKDLPQARTWVSGLAERLRPKAQETSELVTKAQRWYLQEVEAFLQDVKGNDQDGDHFFAYLREVHREIYDDVDSNHASASPHVPSLSKPFGQKFYNLGEIKMPSFDEAMREILAFDPIDGKATTRRQRVLAKIIIDVFQLRMVDLASVLIVLDRALAYPKGSEVVIIMYAGSDHSHTVEKFYRDLGFSAKSLPRQGLVGKGWQDHYGPREPRGLRFPSYLYDFSELFRS